MCARACALNRVTGTVRAQISALEGAQASVREAAAADVAAAQAAAEAAEAALVEEQARASTLHHACTRACYHCFPCVHSHYMHNGVITFTLPI